MAQLEVGLQIRDWLLWQALNKGIEMRGKKSLGPAEDPRLRGKTRFICGTCFKLGGGKRGGLSKNKLFPERRP